MRSVALAEPAPVWWTLQIARKCGRSVSWRNASGGRSRSGLAGRVTKKSTKLRIAAGAKYADKCTGSVARSSVVVRVRDDCANRVLRCEHYPAVTIALDEQASCRY